MDPTVGAAREDTPASVRGSQGRMAAALAIAAFVVVNLVNAIHKGGDFDAYLEAGRRLLGDRPLYAGSDIAVGFVGPPAQALLFVALAPLGDLAARLAWYAANLVLLAYALTTWTRVLVGNGVAGAGRAVPLALASAVAIAFPLQTQFEHQNLNVVLLALTAGAAAALHGGRPSAGGAALGLAAAIKIYPALLLVWLAARRTWSALAAAVAVAVAVSVLPIAFRGAGDFLDDFEAWRRIAGSGWPTRRANQSLAAMWGRYLTQESGGDYPTLTYDHPLALWLAAITALVVIVPLARAMARGPASTHPSIEELACVNALAVLLSPIAWEHYWVAFFPVFLALAVRAWGPSITASRAASPASPIRATLRAFLHPVSLAPAVAFAVGLIGITLLSRPIVGWHGARAVRAWSLMTWGGLVAGAALALALSRRSEEERRRTLKSG